MKKITIFFILVVVVSSWGCGVSPKDADIVIKKCRWGMDFCLAIRADKFVFLHKKRILIVEKLKNIGGTGVLNSPNWVLNDGEFKIRGDKLVIRLSPDADYEIFIRGLYRFLPKQK